MARTAGDVGTPSSWPPPGWHLATCISATRWTSPKKQTPAVMLRWATPDGLYEFEDPIFVTAKALQRLNLVAQRVCAMPGDTALDDDNLKAARFLARYILDNAMGKQADVNVVVEEQVFMHKSGPDIGQKGYRQQSRVSFGGYRVPEGAPEPVPVPQDDPAPEDESGEEWPPADYQPADGEDPNPPADGTEGDIPF